jgi:biotin transport system ATP-binding protein
MILFDGVGVATPEGTPLLRDVSLSLSERRIAIIGANGSGKTTLARLINGLTAPTSGAVSVDGLDTVADRKAVQRRVGFVFQDADHQLVYPTPVEDVALGLRARGRSGRDARQDALAALRHVGLTRKADQAIHTLSGGEKHLVALCAVLALDPAWIVLDEPTTTLDLINRRMVLDVIEGLDQNLVIVTHDLELAGQLDRAVLLSGGEVVAQGDPGQTIDAYVSQVAATR